MNIALSLIIGIVLLLQYVGERLSNTAVLLILIGLIGGAFWFIPSKSALGRIRTELQPCERLLRIIWFGVSGFVVYKTFADGLEYKSEPVRAITTVIRDGSMLMLPILVTNKMGRDALACFGSFGCGLALYAGINIIAYLAGVAPMQSEHLPHASISAQGGERMLAPFAPGLNNFAAMVACGSILCLFACSLAWSVGRFRVVIACSVSLLVCGLALWLVEMRASLAIIGLATFWITAHSFNVKYLLVPIIAIGSAIVPAVYTTDPGIVFLERITPDFVSKYFERRSGDFFTAGGRASIWDYGFQELASGDIGVLGVGSANRDASAAVEEANRRPFGQAALSFHNGPMDLAIVYGAIVGGMIVVVFVVTGLLFVTCNKCSLDKKVIDACSGMLAVILLLNYYEAFAASAFFWSMFVLLLRVRFPLMTRVYNV